MPKGDLQESDVNQNDQEWRGFIRFLIIVVALVACGYPFVNAHERLERDLLIVVIYSIQIGVVILGLPLILVPVSVKFAAIGFITFERMASIEKAMRFVYAAAGVFMCVPLVLNALYFYARWAANDAPPLLGGISVILGGLLLFMVRRRWRVMYGIVEVGIGVVVGTNKFTLGYAIVRELDADWKTLDVTLGVVCAGMYLMVRGLDNVDSGWKDRKDKVAIYLVERVSSTSRKSS